MGILAVLLIIISIGVGLSAKFPDIRGSYTGSTQGTCGSSYNVALNITQQSQGSFQGTFTGWGGSSLLDNSTVDTSGNIQFSINARDAANNNIIVTFNGTAQSGGGWQGTFTDTEGGSGTWSVQISRVL